jgi:hypothetical protein
MISSQSKIQNLKSKIVLASWLLLAVQVAHAALPTVLPEGLMFTGVDGELRQPAPGIYTFAFEKAFVTDKGSVLAGQEVELLPSTSLEYMLRELGGRSSMGLRLWGSLTAYRGRNYIFPSYYLQVAPPAAPAKAEPNKPALPSEPNDKLPRINDAKDEVRIPQQLMEELKATRRVIDIAPAPVAPSEPNRTAIVMETGDALIVDRMGIMAKQAGDGAWSFNIDGLGRSVSGISFRLLPCEVLQRMETQRRPFYLNSTRYRIAGTVTRFQGRYYILPTRVIRAYNNGNLAQ